MKSLWLLAFLLPLSACSRQNAAGEKLMAIAMESRDDEARWESIRKLGALKYRPAIPLLIKALSDPNRDVRANAARALFDMNATESKEQLVALLTREVDGGVIQQATLGIRRFHANEALPALRKLANHDDSQTRIWVLQTIAQFEDKQDVACVASYLESPQIMMQSESAEILGGMTHQDFGVVHQGVSGMQHIDNALRWWDENKLKYPTCSWGLPTQERDTAKLLTDAKRTSNDPGQTQRLIQLLDSSKDSGIRLSAAESLRRKKDPAAVPAMVKLMDDPNRFIQYIGMMTLCEMNRPGGRGCPSTMLFDQSPDTFKNEWRDWWKRKQAGSQ